MSQIHLTTNIIINIVMVLITVIAGFTLHQTGKPYNNFYFAVHKLLTVGFAVFMTRIIVNLLKEDQFETLHYLFLVLAILSILALIFSGGMMSLNKMQEVMVQIHRYSTILFIICISGVLYTIYQFNH